MKIFYEVYTTKPHFTDKWGNPIFLIGTFDSLAIADSWRWDKYWYLQRLSSS